MARLPRYVIPGQPQHIIQRGNNRQAIFAAEADYQFFRDALLGTSLKHGLAIHAYVWMTNHIHLLATPEYDDSISKVFQSVGRKYVQHFNFTYKRSGTLWEGRYRATVVDSEQYLLTLMRYIELIRCGRHGGAPESLSLVELWLQCARRGQAECGLVDAAQGIYAPGPERCRAAKRLPAIVRAAVSDNDMKAIRDCTHKGWALGGERFRAEIEALGKRRAASRGVGRPRKRE